jgi:hypothetical protein
MGKKVKLSLFVFLAFSLNSYTQTVIGSTSIVDVCGSTTTINTTVYVENNNNNYSTLKYRGHLGFYCTDSAYRRIEARRKYIHSIYKSDIKAVMAFTKYLERIKNSLDRYLEEQPERASWDINY